jgi:hypothetical protein
MGVHTINFTADSSGESITFRPITGDGAVVFDIAEVSLKRILVETQVTSLPVKKFLSGETDDGGEVFFRIDTPHIHLQDNFEIYVTPIAIVTRTERGSSMKCFVAFDESDFYEIEGQITKGTSIIKIKDQDTLIPMPALARKVRISWRDSSKQLCRITQGAILYLPTTMDYSQ